MKMKTRLQIGPAGTEFPIGLKDQDHSFSKLLTGLVTVQTTGPIFIKRLSTILFIMI